MNFAQGSFLKALPQENFKFEIIQEKEYTEMNRYCSNNFPQLKKKSKQNPLRIYSVLSN